MIANLLQGQIVFACIVGVLAGASYYAVGAWLLGRRRSPVTVEVRRGPVAVEQDRVIAMSPRSRATDEAIENLVHEFVRLDQGSARRRGKQQGLGG